MREKKKENKGRDKDKRVWRKKKKKTESESESWREKRQDETESTYGKEGEKERKEGGDEIRTNVYGGKKHKITKTNKQTYG